MSFRTKISNNKQKESYSITDITKQDFRKLLNKFNSSPYLGYKSKQVHNETYGVYLLLIKHITKLMKIERHVWLLTNFFKSGGNKTIGHVNKTIGHVNKAIQYEELEGINEKTKCTDKDKQPYSACDIKGKENA